MNTLKDALVQSLKIEEMKDGPAKKFYLMKHFGDRLRRLTPTDLRLLSCADMVALLQKDAH